MALTPDEQVYMTAGIKTAQFTIPMVIQGIAHSRTEAGAVPTEATINRTVADVKEAVPSLFHTPQL